MGQHFSPVDGQIRKYTVDYPQFRKLENGDIEVTDFTDITANWPRPVPVSERLPPDNFDGMFGCKNGWNFGSYAGIGPTEDLSQENVPIFNPRGADWMNLPFTHWMESPPAPKSDASATQCSPPEPSE